MLTIPKSEVYALVKRCFENAGLSDCESIDIIFDHLIQNEMAQKRSHGLLRVKWCVDYMQKHGAPDQKPSLALDLGALAIVDGQNNIGVVAARYAVDTAKEKAKEHGIAFVGARNHFGTTGTMHYYNRLFVKEGLIGMAGCNSLSMVSHPNGIDPVLGTNPISFGFPSTKTPCIIDVTTAQWAYGKLLELYKAGKPMPDNAFIDKDGAPSTDIKDAMDGAMLPLAGHKGFSIGLAIEILSGALIDAKSGCEAINGSDGIFFIAIDPDKLVGRTQFESNVEALLQEIKQTRSRDTSVDILIPGERSETALLAAQEKDTIDIVDTVYNDLKDMAA